MFEELLEINKRPRPFEYYTASELWTNEHTSKKMLEYHLNESIDVSSRNINFINKSVAWIIEHFNLNSDSELIDFGCGPGFYTTRFARNKIKVTGIDFSKSSIEYAKQIASKENLDINYIQANYLEYESSKKFDLITMIMCDYCALSPQQRKLMLNKFKRILKNDGSILLDVYSLNYYNNQEEKAIYEFNQLSKFWSPEDYYAFQNIFKYDKEKVILDKYTIIEKSRKRVVYNWLQYYNIDALRSEFEENGFNIVEVYSDVAGSEYESDSLEFAITAKIQ
ncbi:MAG: class I SAM-dependent methyltransferase [Saprospiraceae bacterium]|nr:class I SAM-dependent methyltransferase [Saprospiraceae bacterium]